MTPSDDEQKDEAIHEKIKKHAEEWAEEVDKTVNWRFEQLHKAGYDLIVCEELANNRAVDLHKVIELAEEHGAKAAYLRFL